MNYKLTISYDGKSYDGWQKQGNTDRTIQGKLETLLSRLDGSEVKVQGAGRTDAGVHAKAQVCNAVLSSKWNEEELRDTINSYLPMDIAVTDVKEAPDRFHARLNAVGKTYKYRIFTGKVMNVFERNYVFNYGKKLSCDKMKTAASYLIGTHDFKAFCANKHMKKTTVRTIEDISFIQKEDEIEITYYGNGFLYNMVRIITGTLIEIGEGKKTPESIKDILESKERSNAGFTAPANGLILWSVDYE
ncbi:MAG: tRNA pseudouridine(38-40) synthase TruA [Lachnospiraceae bacterium]|nr:tRNA pseudouridine(38-40) synthase TruA [Lachnospiraceae bacterium]